MTIVAAADGSALGNPGPAGWAWFIDEDCWASGGWRHGTNNLGELTAVLELLRATAGVEEDLLIYCDSRYVINSITQWMPGWKANGWVKKDRKPVLNLEVMQALDEAMRGRRVRFEWVKGHSGHALNEAADERANAAAVACRHGQQPDPGPGFSAAALPDRTAQGFAVAEPEPDLFSDLEAAGNGLDYDLDVVVDLERSLLTEEVRNDPPRVAALLHPEWTEFGAGGLISDRDGLLARIAAFPSTVSLDLLEARRIGEDAVLLRWRSHHEDGAYLRSSLWVRSVGAGWQQLFHQGTPEA